MVDEYDFSQAVRRNSHQSLEGRTIRIETESGDRDVQIRTIETSACVNDEGRVTLQVPPDLAPGEYQLNPRMILSEIGGKIADWRSRA